MYDDVLLVTSELVTNAVRVADAEVALRARLDADGVTIEVEDDGTGGLRWPRPQHLRHDLYSETGRGLVIVEELSGEVAVFSDDDGTVVRCARHAAGLSTPIDRLIRVVSERLTVSTEAAPERAPRGIFDPPSN